MANKKNNTNIRDERIEDTTMYGEFVSSFDQWMTPDRQKANARHLEEISKITAGDNKAVKNNKNKTK